MISYDRDGHLRMYLVQRLTKAPTSEFEGKLPRAFGGGMILLEEAGWNLIQTAFNIEPMHAAEYEFGILPKCLKKVAESIEDYSFWDFEITPASMGKPYWRDTRKQTLRRKEISDAKQLGVKPPRINHKRLEAQIPPVPTKRVWVMSHRYYLQHLVQGTVIHIQECESGLSLNKRVTRDETGFLSVLDPEPGNRWGRETCGWFSLEHGIFWFTDEETAKKTWDLFQQFKDTKEEVATSG